MPRAHCAADAPAYVGNRRERRPTIVNAFLQRLGIAHPILLAPMAGAGGTPELAQW